MNAALASKIRHAYLLEKANLRLHAEEAKSQKCRASLAAINKRREQVQLRKIKADEVDRDSSVSDSKGLGSLNQMNIDLEALIREVYQQITSVESGSFKNEQK